MTAPRRHLQAVQQAGAGEAAVADPVLEPVAGAEGSHSPRNPRPEATASPAPERPEHLGWFDEHDAWHPPATWADELRAAAALADNLAGAVPTGVLLVPAADVEFRARRLALLLADLLASLPQDVA